MKKFLILAFIFLVHIQLVSAAITQTYTGAISGVRVEGSTGLLSISKSLIMVTGEDTNCRRVWVDLNSYSGRAAYSTALMAMSTKKTRVDIRGHDQPSNKRYGACQIYDIYVPQN